MKKLLGAFLIITMMLSLFSTVTFAVQSYIFNVIKISPLSEFNKFIHKKCDLYKIFAQKNVKIYCILAMICV